jgi:hypothetical protein
MIANNNQPLMKLLVKRDLITDSIRDNPKMELRELTKLRGKVVKLDIKIKIILQQLRKNFEVSNQDDLDSVF